MYTVYMYRMYIYISIYIYTQIFSYSGDIVEKYEVDIFGLMCI